MESEEATLIIKQSGKEDLEFKLNKEKPIIIGRDKRCNIIIPENYAEVSRKHLKIGYNPNKKAYEITDPESTNGTYINYNKKRIKHNTTHQLKNGDKIELGIIEKIVLIFKQNS